jgi:hypothetical protein
LTEELLIPDRNLLDRLKSTRCQAIRFGAGELARTKLLVQRPHAFNVGIAASFHLPGVWDIVAEATPANRDVQGSAVARAVGFNIRITGHDFLIDRHIPTELTLQRPLALKHGEGFSLLINMFDHQLGRLDRIGLEAPFPFEGVLGRRHHRRLCQG